MSTSASIDTQSYWIDSESLPRFPKLARDERADVVVVGGGITGLTAAFLLTRAGRSVAVLERDRCARIDTGHTSAHVTMVTDMRLSDLVKSFGRDHAQAVWDAGLAAIAQIDDIVRSEAIDCGFAWVPNYVHAPGLMSSNVEDVDFREEARIAAELGFDAEFVADVPVMGQPGVRYDNQARFHPRMYLAGLARAIEKAGGRIYEHSEACEFNDQPLSVTANGCTITCGDVMLATHTPLTGNSNIAVAMMFQSKLALYTSYVVAGRAPHRRVPDALFSDTADPYHYLRVDPHRDYDVVIFGGEDHKTGQATDTDACYARLERDLRVLIPDVAVTHRWSGQVIETPDGLPYLGRNAEHQYSATGFAGNGMTFGTLGAMIAVDGILGRANPWTDLFETGRTKVRHSLWDYVRENKDYPYYLIRDRFAGAEGRTLRSLKRGEGRILDLNGTRVAAYRDEDGKAVLRSPTCTHLGCEVAWNGAERTWDCPCHGSRFKPDGEVIAGPAESPLPEIER
ncbi:MAG: FAD-dependent oxidoreductase [Acidobacteria bacterium]|nr:MAG: FAD-dependent oxidoreductase [Acidobacteriota bacterium]